MNHAGSRLFSSLLIAAAAGCARTTAVGSPAPGGEGRPTGTIIASNMNDHTASLIDATDGRTIATLPTGKGPHEVAVSHDGRWAVVSNYGVGREAGSTITVIDVASATVARTIDLGTYRRPHGIAFLPGDTTLLVTSEAARAVLVVGFSTGTVHRTIPSYGRGSHMLGLSAKGDRIVVANIGDGTITLGSTSGASDSTTIRVARQPEAIAISPSGSEAWSGSNRDSLVTVVDLATRRVTDTIRGFGLAYRIAIAPDERRVVITDPAKGVVRVIDRKTRGTLATIAFKTDSILPAAEFPGSPSPEGVAISPDSRWAFVTLQGRNQVVTIDLGRSVVVGYAPTGNWSDGVGYSPVRARPAR